MDHLIGRATLADGGEVKVWIDDLRNASYTVYLNGDVLRHVPEPGAGPWRIDRLPDDRVAADVLVVALKWYLRDEGQKRRAEVAAESTKVKSTPHIPLLKKDGEEEDGGEWREEPIPPAR